jgi:hypothetical protein
VNIPMTLIYGRCQNVFGLKCRGNVNWVESVCITMIGIGGLNVRIIRGVSVLKGRLVRGDM